MATLEARVRARKHYLETHRIIGTCTRCGVEFNKPYRTKPYLFCSKRCMSLGNTLWLGRKHSPETREKMRINRLLHPLTPTKGKLDAESHNWKGDAVGYQGLHTWVRKRLGTPKECEHCGKIVNNRGIHWANISHEYKRDLEDWIRLCASCHGLYDRNKINLTKGEKQCLI